MSVDEVGFGNYSRPTDNWTLSHNANFDNEHIDWICFEDLWTIITDGVCMSALSYEYANSKVYNDIKITLLVN